VVFGEWSATIVTMEQVENHNINEQLPISGHLMHNGNKLRSLPGSLMSRSQAVLPISS